MKTFIVLVSTLGAAIALASPSAFTPVAMTTIDQSRVTLLRSIDLDDQRSNGDGHLFYRTAYKVVLDDGRGKTEKTLDTDLYTPKDLTPLAEHMRPSFLIDPAAKVLTIFAIGKGPNNRDYSMNGYAYRLDSSKEWTKEVVFGSGNFGWFSYFGGSASGNPELWHFSFAGYRQMRSFRSDSGQWQTLDLGRISPEDAVSEMQRNKNILISTAWNDQRPVGYSSSSGQASTSNSSDAGAIVGAVIAGAIVVGTVKWLLEPFRGGSSTTSSSYSSNSSGPKRYSCSFLCRGPLYATGGRHTVNSFGSDETSARESVKEQAEKLCMSTRGGSWWADMSLCKEQ